MDSFRLSIFDLFGAIIPGIPMLILIISLFDQSPSNILNLIERTENLSLSTSLLALLFAYLIGFSTQYLSYEVFNQLVPLWGKKRKIGFPISFGKRGEEVSLIREKAPKNYKVLNTFFAHRTMCYNGFFSLLPFGIGIPISNFIKGGLYVDVLVLTLICLIFSFILLRRAVSFHEWSHDLISDSIFVIKKMKKN